MDFVEKQLSTELIFDGKVIHLYFDRIALPDGKEATREYIRHVGAVCVVPVTAEGEIICVRQYRYALGRMVTEIPAGKLDYAGEIPEEAALRELREETGAICGKLTHIGRYYGSPALLDERIEMYLAEDLTFGECDPDADEFLDIVRIPMDQLCEMIVDGKIEDGKTQCAVLKVARILEKRVSNGE